MNPPGAAWDIRPLSRADLAPAVALVNRVFEHPVWDTPVIALRASLHPRLLAPVLAIRGVSRYRCWVAEVGGEVVGVTGIYDQRRDRHEAAWLGWFCVTPEIRGKGLGDALIETACRAARDDGKRYLRLYTSTHPIEREAQAFYASRGFRETRRRRGTIWRELRLDQC